MATGKELKTLSEHSRSVWGVAWSADGKQLASGSDDNTIKIWNVATGKELKTLIGHGYYVYSVAWSADGKQLASGSDDNTIKIWDVATGKEFKTLSGHSSNVNSVAWSADGKQLASGSDDKNTKLWDAATGKQLKTLIGHSRSVNSVAWSADGKQLASGSSDNTVILWDLDLDNLIGDACNLLNNYLIANPETLEELEKCQTPSLREKAAEVLVIQGEKLARQDSIDTAVKKFRKAQQWNSSLKFDVEAKAKEFANKGQAENLVDNGRQLAKEGKVKDAIAAYNKAQQLDSKIAIDAESWVSLCWDGSLHRRAADVMFACEKAVKLDPKNGYILNSRGLARALTGNARGAIEDFEVCIAQLEDKELKSQRQQWVKALRAGQNPFTDAELKKLLGY
ncbi:hypothetical protein NUACC21_23890 [Scytonema sp. NUACC21]